MTATGVLICGHGSREATAVREFRVLAGQVAARLPQFRIETGFLEFSTPSIPDGLEKLRQIGCRNILVIPGTLFSGGHAQRDIPAILQAFVAQFPEIRVRYGQAFDIHPDFVRAACERVSDAIDTAYGGIAPEETAMLMVARGASDPEVLASVRTISRHIHIAFNFAHSDVAFSGMASPLFSSVLERIAEHDFRRVIILPYFLFTGTLVQRIYDGVDEIAASHPEKQFLKCPYLSNHPSVIDGFIARIVETGQTGMVMHG